MSALEMETLSREILLHGKGVHSGVKSTIRFRRRDDALPRIEGIRFFWPGWHKPLSAGELGSLKRTSRRATVLEGNGGQAFGTPEHLLAACLFFADEPFDILSEASEPPGLDGSALPFFKALNKTIESTHEVTAQPGWREYDSDLKWEHEGPEGWVRTSPSDAFSVDYEWSKGSLRQRFSLKDAATAIREILPARTFIHYRDWLAAKDSGALLVGADSNSGLLLAESAEEFEMASKRHPEFEGKTFPLLHPESFRMNDEPVRHKMLDLLGDLALLGLALPRLHLEIRNGGHNLNHLLLEQLLLNQTGAKTP